MRTQTVKLPAFLASALANGDVSGLTCNCGALDDIHEHAKGCDFYWLAKTHEYVAPGHVAGTACTCGREDERDECAPECGEASFGRYCDLPGFTLGADMLDYVVLYPEGA